MDLQNWFDSIVFIEVKQHIFMRVYTSFMFRSHQMCLVSQIRRFPNVSPVTSTRSEIETILILMLNSAVGKLLSSFDIHFVEIS